ncbi:DUF4292 domain-containing protein [Pontibacter rugosus]|uniref:DUF4292 domain-containing protein n=1 Tax=Pontibacter rugosus TaxID=1745966 RepID=A0ABW3SM13_9BACT
MSKHILLCLLAAILLAGCKKETVPTTASATTETIGKVNVSNLDYTYLSGKGQVSIKDKKNDLSSGVSIRMKKDSIIWMSVLPGLGIEAARMMMTQDSVYFMNRLQKEYVATDYTFLRNKFQVDIDFEAVQAIILGNYQAQGAEKVMSAEGLQHVQQQRENLIFDYFIGNLNSKVQQLNVQDKNTGNTISVKYKNFQNVGQVSFAHGLEAQVLQKGEVSGFTLDQSRITVADAPLSFPFSVPSGYKRVSTN